MGVWGDGQDASGTWKIMHAATEPMGIVYEYRANAYFSDNAAKRFKRVNW